MIKRILIFCAVVASITSCFKDEEYNSQLVFRPMQQLASGGDYTDFAGVKVYAFQADTALYYITSYAEALEGVIRSDINDEPLAPTAVSTPYSSSVEGFESAVSLTVDYENVMLVAVDTVNEDYAYCNYTLGMNLPQTYITLTFTPWLEGSSFKNKWYYVTPEAIVVPDPDIDPDIDPNIDPDTEI